MLNLFHLWNNLGVIWRAAFPPDPSFTFWLHLWTHNVPAGEFDDVYFGARMKERLKSHWEALR